MDFKQKKDQIEAILEPSIEVDKKIKIEDSIRIITSNETSYEVLAEEDIKETIIVFVVFVKKPVMEKKADCITTTIRIIDRIVAFDLDRNGEKKLVQEKNREAKGGMINHKESMSLM